MAHSTTYPAPDIASLNILKAAVAHAARPLDDAMDSLDRHMAPETAVPTAPSTCTSR